MFVISYVSRFVLTCFQPSSCTVATDVTLILCFPSKRVQCHDVCLTICYAFEITIHESGYKVYVMYFNCCNLDLSLSLILYLTQTLFVSLFGTLVGLRNPSKNLLCVNSDQEGAAPCAIVAFKCQMAHSNVTTLRLRLISFA